MTDLYDHPQVLALLDSAKETPEEDAPRLVLADWLEDHGDSKRAEFIRLQLQLSADREMNPVARSQMESLLCRYGGSWRGSLWQYWLHPARWNRGLLSAGLSRGLPEEESSAFAWIDTVFWKVVGQRNLARLARMLGKVQPNHLFIDLADPVFPERRLLEALCRSPELPWLRSLSFELPPGFQRRRSSQGEQINIPNLSADFLAELLSSVPLCRRLTPRFTSHVVGRTGRNHSLVWCYANSGKSPFVDAHSGQCLLQATNSPLLNSGLDAIQPEEANVSRSRCGACGTLSPCDDHVHACAVASVALLAHRQTEQGRAGMRPSL